MPRGNRCRGSDFDSISLVDDQGAALSALMTTTDMNGFARVSFYAGGVVRNHGVEARHNTAASPDIFRRCIGFTYQLGYSFRLS